MVSAKKHLLNLDAELAAALAEHKQKSGVPTNEYIRRAIRLALFGDAQAARNTRPEPAATT